MTTEERDPVQATRSLAFDFFQADSPYRVRPAELQGRNRIVFSSVRGHPNVIRYDITFEGLSDGLDSQQISIPNSGGIIPGYLAYSELEHRFERTLCLLPLIESDTDTGKVMGGGSNGEEALSAAILPNEFTQGVIVGGGATANQALFTIDNDSNVLNVVAQTYSPGSLIHALADVDIATGTRRLFVGRAAGAAQILSGIDGSPTVAGTMHADTEPGYGAIMSPLNATTSGETSILILSNNSIYLLSSAAAIGDAPTQKLSGINDGGYAIGDVTLPGSPPRAYWGIPEDDLGTLHVLYSASGSRFQIWSTDFLGDDPQILDMGVDFLIHALKYRGGIVGTDGQKIVWHTGDLNDLGWGRARERDSTTQFNVACLAVLEERLLVGVVETNSSSAVTSMYWEEFDFGRGAWYAASVRDDPDVASQPFLCPAGFTPVFHNNDHEEAATYGHRFAWYRRTAASDEGWYSMSILPSQINPFYWQNASEVFRYFATSGTARTPVYHFYSGFPKIFTDVWFGGEFPTSANADGSVVVEVAEQLGSSLSFTDNPAASFSEADRWDRHFWINPGFTSFDRLKLQVTVNQGTGSGATRTTPNALPFRIGGYIFLDNQPKEDWRKMEPWRWEQRQ